MLHHDVIGPEGGRSALIAHGILGMGRNWRSMARRLSEALPEWRFILVDLRNHGRSQGLPGPHTVASCAQDLAALATELGGIEVAVGHSFGGKVVLEWQRSGAGLEQVWALDSPPGARSAHVQSVDTLGVIAALRAVRVPAATRDDLRSQLSALEPSLVAWLLTSARHDPDGWRWVWDLEAIDAMIRDYLALDLLPWLTTQPGDVQLVRAGRSDRWTAEEVNRLTPQLLSNAGHWVHVDDPAGLLALLTEHWVR